MRHERIEAWILEQAGVAIAPASVPVPLLAVG